GPEGRSQARVAGVPDADATVHVGRGDQPAGRRVADGVQAHVRARALRVGGGELAADLGRVRVPEPDPLVPAGGRQRPAVRAKGEAVDHVVGQVGDFAARADVPDAGR